MFMQALDDLDIFFRRIKTLVVLAQILQRDGFQAHQQSFAAAARRQPQRNSKSSASNTVAATVPPMEFSGISAVKSRSA